MTGAPAPSISPELQCPAATRQARGASTPTPRLSLARTGGMGHAEFLELVLAEG